MQRTRFANLPEARLRLAGGDKPRPYIRFGRSSMQMPKNLTCLFKNYGDA